MIPSRVASSVVRRHVKYLTPVSAFAATGLVWQVYDQISDEMLLVVPPALAHSPRPDLLAAYWMLLREPLLPPGEVDRATKEAVATAVSLANTCPFCVEMHNISLFDLSTEHDAAAIGADRVDEMADPRLREAAAWARAAHRAPAGPAFPPGLSAAGRAELIGVAVSMNYVSRIVNVFLTNVLVPAGLGPRARRRFMVGASRLMRPTLRDPRAPGRSINLLPPAGDAGAGPAWAGGNAAVAEAMSRAGAAFAAAGRRSVSPAVRAVVEQRLASWQGEETGLHTGWCDELTAGLSPAERSAARLALLTALASYQVSETVVRDFRTWHPSDGALLDVVAWASFAASSQIGARQDGPALGGPATTSPEPTSHARSRGPRASTAR